MERRGSRIPGIEWRTSKPSNRGAMVCILLRLQAAGPVFGAICLWHMALGLRPLTQHPRLGDSPANCLRSCLDRRFVYRPAGNLDRSFPVSFPRSFPGYSGYSKASCDLRCSVRCSRSYSDCCGLSRSPRCSPRNTDRCPHDCSENRFPGCLRSCCLHRCPGCKDNPCQRASRGIPDLRLYGGDWRIAGRDPGACAWAKRGLYLRRALCDSQGLSPLCPPGLGEIAGRVRLWAG